MGKEGEQRAPSAVVGWYVTGIADEGALAFAKHTVAVAMDTEAHVTMSLDDLIKQGKEGKKQGGVGEKKTLTKKKKKAGAAGAVKTVTIQKKTTKKGGKVVSTKAQIISTTKAQ